MASAKLLTRSRCTLQALGISPQTVPFRRDALDSSPTDHTGQLTT